MATDTNLDEVRRWKKSILLVSVSGNSLQLNPDAVNLFEGSAYKDLPLVVISVVGQPKARKTSLINTVLKYFPKYQQVSPDPFPLTSEDPEYSDLNGQEGILLWKYPEPVSSVNGSRSVWCFMDIWMEYPRASVYKKLVDFCLTNSSTVIFSEPLDPNPEIYWEPFESVLSTSTTFKEFRNSLQLHFFLQTDESSRVFYSNRYGIPDTEQCRADFTEKLQAVTNAAHFLEPRCKCVTTSFVPVKAEKETHSLMLAATENIFGRCLQNPFEINNELVKISGFCLWLQMSIQANNSTEMIVSALEIKIKGSNSCVPYLSASSSAPSGPEQEIVASEIGSVANSDPLYKLELTDEDIEMLDTWSEPNVRVSSAETSTASSVIDKEVTCQPLTKSKVPRAVEPTEVLRDLSKYYVSCFKAASLNIPNNRLYFDDSELLNHHNEISQQTLHKFKAFGYPIETESMIISKLSEWFQKIKDINNKQKTKLRQLESETIAKLHEIVEYIENQLEEQLNKDPSNFYFRFNSEIFDIVTGQVTGIHPKFQKKIVNFLAAAKKDLQTTMESNNLMILTYVQNFEVLLEEKICLESTQFEQFHKVTLEKSKASAHYKESDYKKIDVLCKIAIECNKKKFHEQNSRAYLQEEEESKEAYNYAIQKYKDFVDNKISSSTLTEQDLQRIHHFAVETITKLFLSELQEPHTQPWRDQQVKLTEYLSNLLINSKQKNQKHLKKVEFTKKEGFNSAKLRYQEVMNKSLPETQLTDGLLNDYHNKAQHQAIARLKEKTSNIHQQISNGWEVEFRNNSIAELKQRYENDNDRKKQQPPSYAAAVQQQIEHNPPAENRLGKSIPYGIGLYIAPQQVCVGVYVNQEVKFEQQIISYEPPDIAIINGKVSIGKEADEDFNGQTSEGLYYNIFALLQTHNDFEQRVIIDGKQAKLGREEILSIFFHRVRVNLEKDLNRRVNSCYVAVTGLLSSGAKQILKTSLTIAGFQDNKIISCTTAMAVSYILKSLKGRTLAGRNKSIILTYATAKLVEMASVNVTEQNIRVRSLVGHMNVYNEFEVSKVQQLKNLVWGESKLEQCIKHLLKAGTSSQLNYDDIVVCYGNYVDPQLDLALRDQLTISKLGSSNFSFSVVNDIVRVAAALDAKRNHPDLISSQINFPSYNIISPYCITGKFNQKPMRFIPFNSQVSIKSSYSLASSVQGNVVIKEFAKGIKNEWLVAQYEFKTRANENSEFVLNLNEEGNLTVTTNPKGLIIQTNSKSMVASECQRISEFLTPVISSQERLHGIILPVEQLQEPVIKSETMKLKDPAAESKERDNLVQGVEALVEKVKQQLESSKNTSAAVKNNILTKIEKCKELTGSNNGKAKQLEMAKTNLERAAKLIK